MKTILKVDEYFEDEDGQLEFEKTADNIAIRYELINIDNTIYELKFINDELQEAINVTYLYNMDGTIKFTNMNDDEDDLPF